MKGFYSFIVFISILLPSISPQEFPEIVPVFYGQGVVTFGDPQAPNDKIQPYPSLGSGAWFRQLTGFSVESIGDFWELKAQGQVLWDGNSIGWESGETWVQTDWQKILYLRLGYQKISPGPGRVLDLWPQPVPKDSTQFLAWGGNEPQSTQPMVNLRGIWENFVVETHILPFKPQIPLADTGGPWFFKAQVPSFFEVPGVGQYTLNTLGYKDSPEQLLEWSPSLVSQVRWSLDNFEILGAYYAGWDALPPINAQASLPGGYLFNLLLWPERKPLQQFVLGFQYSGNDLDLWAEGRGSVNKVLVLDKTLSGISIPLGEPFMTVDQGVLEVCGGAAWKFAIDWELSLEASGWWSAEHFNLEIPDYSRSWATSLRWSPGFLPLSSSLVILGSLKSFSGLGVLNLSYQWTEGVEIWGQVPAFWGESGTEWGQYSKRVLGQLGWRWIL